MYSDKCDATVTGKGYKIKPGQQIGQGFQPTGTQGRSLGLHRSLGYQTVAQLAIVNLPGARYGRKLGDAI